jgi:hypothetical protein
LKSGDGAATIARAYRKQVIDGPIQRTPSRIVGS